jgi:hypothetical protein
MVFSGAAESNGGSVVDVYELSHIMLPIIRL